MSKLSFRKLQGNVDGRDLRTRQSEKFSRIFFVPNCGPIAPAGKIGEPFLTNRNEHHQVIKWQEKLMISSCYGVHPAILKSCNLT